MERRGMRAHGVGAARLAGERVSGGERRVRRPFWKPRAAAPPRGAPDWAESLSLTRSSPGSGVGHLPGPGLLTAAACSVRSEPGAREKGLPKGRLGVGCCRQPAVLNRTWLGGLGARDPAHGRTMSPQVALRFVMASRLHMLSCVSAIESSARARRRVFNRALPSCVPGPAWQNMAGGCLARP